MEKKKTHTYAASDHRELTKIKMTTNPQLLPQRLHASSNAEAPVAALEIDATKKPDFAALRAASRRRRKIGIGLVVVVAVTVVAAAAVWLSSGGGAPNADPSSQSPLSNASSDSVETTPSTPAAADSSSSSSSTPSPVAVDKAPSGALPSAGTGSPSPSPSQNGDPTNAPHGLPRTDYMSMLGEDEASGKRQPFMAENRVYYLTSPADDPFRRPDDRLGIWHPYFHDLRSRGVGIASYEPDDGSPGTGVGNDYAGWEWYRATSVAVGSVVDTFGPPLPGGAKMRWDAPKPDRTWWRPDKVISEYDLSGESYLSGTYLGWCTTGSTTTASVDWWGWNTFSSPSECFEECDASATCASAVYEIDANGKTQCWIGPNMLLRSQTPDGSQRGGNDALNATCYAKPMTGIAPVTIREEKFVTITEVVAVVITASRPVTLEFVGGSFTSTYRDARPNAGIVGGLRSLNATCSSLVRSDSTTLRVDERGRANAKVMPSIEREGPFVLDGMSAALTSSRPMENVSITRRTSFFGPVCDYSFHFTVDNASVALAWAMNDGDDWSETLQRTRDVAEDASTFSRAKTSKMNGLLNDVVPYFRCSDRDVVKIYYYLWSVYLMLYIDVGEGLESMPHTQSAANNFLGMHRFDAVFQIAAGAWISPDRHDFYAHGNVLVWENVLDRGLNSSNMLPDNFGIDWGSGVFGNEVVLHVLGALDIYEHSGDVDFLSRAYGFYRKLFWTNDFWIENCFHTAYDAVLALNTMAKVLNRSEDAVHWNQTTGMNYWTSDFYQTRRDAQWGDAQNWNVSNGEAAFGWLDIAKLGMRRETRVGGEHGPNLAAGSGDGAL